MFVALIVSYVTIFFTMQFDRKINYMYIAGMFPTMLCNALAGIYFAIRGAQAVISIITGKVTCKFNQLII